MEKLDDAILDEEDGYLSNPKLMDFIAWWERGRLFYNIALLLACGIAIAKNWYNAKNAGLFSVSLTFFYYCFLANVCYTFGWSSELLRIYYNKRSTAFFYRLKVVFWLLMTSCSGAYLYRLLEAYLENWSPFMFFEF